MITGFAQISINAPAMKVRMVNLHLEKTYAEPMVATITFADGSTLVVKDMIIPETFVRPNFWPWTWAVDACVGQDKNGIVTVNLPKEPVDVYLFRGYAIAKKIVCPTVVKLPTGEVGSGSVLFPDCKLLFSNQTAESVVAVGTIVF